MVEVEVYAAAQSRGAAAVLPAGGASIKAGAPPPQDAMAAGGLQSAPGTLPARYTIRPRCAATKSPRWVSAYRSQPLVACPGANVYVLCAISQYCVVRYLVGYLFPHTLKQKATARSSADAAVWAFHTMDEQIALSQINSSGIYDFFRRN